MPVGAPRTAEVVAALDGEPTRGSSDVFLAAKFDGRPVVIVTNNADEAVEAYLRRHKLGTLVLGIVGREPGHPELMKPNTRPVQLALDALDAEPRTCAFVGDSVTDIEVSRSTGVHSIGYAKTPARGQQLDDAGAGAITDSMAELAATLRPT